MGDYVGLKEAAVILDCHEATVKRMVHSGRLPYFRLHPSKNSKIHIKRTDVLNYLARRKAAAREAHDPANQRLQIKELTKQVVHNFKPKGEQYED